MKPSFDEWYAVKNNGRNWNDVMLQHYDRDTIFKDLTEQLRKYVSELVQNV